MLGWVDSLSPNFAKSDEARRLIHAEALATWDAEWSLGATGDLLGPFGTIMAREIRKRFAPGPRVETDTGAPAGPSQRHQQLARSIRADWHAMRRIVEPWAMIHRAPASIRGESTEHPAWSYLRQWSLLDTTLVHKLQWALALRGCPVRLSWVPTDATMQRFYAPTLTVVPPERVTAIAHPNNPLFPIAVIEHPESPRDVVKLWDLSDASNPTFSGWANVASIYSKRIAGRKWIVGGNDYPWRWRGRPILPWVLYQGDYAAQSLLPASTALQNDTIIKILRDAWLDWLQFVGSFDRAVVLSEVPLVGFEQAMIDPSNVLNLYPEASDSIGSGGAKPDLKVIPNASATVERLRKIEATLTAQMVQRYHSSFRAESSGTPESGVAIALRMDGQHQERQQQETAHRPRDLQLIRVLIAGWNHLVSAGMIRGTVSQEDSGESSVWLEPGLQDVTPELLIPECDDLSIEYPVVWRPEEKREILTHIADAVSRGLDSRVSYYLVENDIPDTPAHRRAALATLESRGLEELHTLRLGLGVNRDTLYKSQPSVPSEKDFPEYLSATSRESYILPIGTVYALRDIETPGLPDTRVAELLHRIHLETGAPVDELSRVWQSSLDGWLLRHAPSVTDVTWAAGCLRRVLVDRVAEMVQSVAGVAGVAGVASESEGSTVSLFAPVESVEAQ